MKHKEAETIIAKHFGEAGVLLFEKTLAQQPEKADVIVLLQGDRLDRVASASALYEQGFAPHILIIGNNELAGADKRPGENDVSLEELRHALVDCGAPEAAVTVQEKALNTLEQAVGAMKIAKERGWSKLIVVTSAYHAMRAYLTLQKQAEEQNWKGGIIMHAVVLPWDESPGGREKTAKEMLEVEMGKIREYKNDMAPMTAFSHNVREAERNDSRYIFAIRNHPAIRKVSGNPESISFDKHDEWFEKQYFGRADNHCFVLESPQGEVIGYCRLDFDGGQNAYGISIALDPEHQGRGLGRLLLREVLARFGGGKDIVATIKKENVPSRELFKKHGFQISSQDEENYYLAYSRA